MKTFQVIIINLFLYCCVIATENTLKQVHVLFRHGDRNPDRDSLYPTDPHLNDTYYPDGNGALTKLGKMQEYNIGKALRERYNSFLGDIYTPDILEARSTDFNRTKMSLQLVLAGLWPPAKTQVWNEELPWLPIPYNYFSDDDLLKYPADKCPRYIEEYERVEKVDKFQYFYIKNADLIQYVEENSGLNMTSFLDLYGLYFTLYAEERTGRELPEWTNKIWPEFMEAGTKLCYEAQTYNDFLLQAMGGRMLKEVLDDAKSMLNGTSSTKYRKMYLYSAHESNIAHALAALNLFESHIPPYASHILFELHKIDEEHGFKIFYQDYKQNEPRLMQIPGCDNFCPIKQFEELHEHIMTRDC